MTDILLFENLKSWLLLIASSSLMVGANFFSNPEVARAEFTSHCGFDNITITAELPDRVKVEAKCGDKKAKNPLFVSNRIGNIDGVLTWGTRGFQKSCSSNSQDYGKRYDVVRDATFLTVRNCKKQNGTLVDAEINLDDGIGFALDKNNNPYIRYIYNGAIPTEDTEQQKCISIPGPPTVPVCK